MISATGFLAIALACGRPKWRQLAADVVVAAMNEALEKLDLKFPQVDKDARAALDAAQAQLESER
jgi:methylase of polypeptide subunit release factors